MQRFCTGALLGLLSTAAQANVPMAGLASERLSARNSQEHVEVSYVPPVAQVQAPVETARPSLAVVAVAGNVPTSAAPGSALGPGSEVLVAQTHAGAPESPPLGPLSQPASNSSSVESTGNEASPEQGREATEVEPESRVLSEEENAEYQRFFGDDAAEGAGAPVEMDSGISMWIWPAILLGIVGTWFWRKRKGEKKDTRDEISIVGRASLGREGSLAVIEVEDSDGQPRRLLVGYGGGAPRLVADLADSETVRTSGYSQGSEGLGGREKGTEAAAWNRAIEQAEEGLDMRRPSEDLIANVLADRDQLRKSLGELPNGSRAATRRRAYRGTMV